MILVGFVKKVRHMNCISQKQKYLGAYAMRLCCFINIEKAENVTLKVIIYYIMYHVF